MHIGLSSARNPIEWGDGTGRWLRQSHSSHASSACLQECQHFAEAGHLINLFERQQCPLRGRLRNSQRTSTFPPNSPFESIPNIPTMFLMLYLKYLSVFYSLVMIVLGNAGILHRKFQARRFLLLFCKGTGVIS